VSLENRVYLIDTLPERHSFWDGVVNADAGITAAHGIIDNKMFHGLRGGPAALGKEAFAGSKAPRGFRREQTLSEALTERKGPFTERNPALGEGPESCSEGAAASARQPQEVRTPDQMKIDGSISVSITERPFRLLLDQRRYPWNGSRITIPYSYSSRVCLVQLQLYEIDSRICKFRIYNSKICKFKISQTCFAKQCRQL
jgi:hypothetical protein